MKYFEDDNEVEVSDKRKDNYSKRKASKDIDRRKNSHSKYDYDDDDYDEFVRNKKKKH